MRKAHGGGGAPRAQPLPQKPLSTTTLPFVSSEVEKPVTPGAGFSTSHETNGGWECRPYRPSRVTCPILRPGRVS